MGFPYVRLPVQVSTANHAVPSVAQNTCNSTTTSTQPCSRPHGEKRTTREAPECANSCQVSGSQQPAAEGSGYAVFSHAFVSQINSTPVPDSQVCPMDTEENDGVQTYSNKANGFDKVAGIYAIGSVPIPLSNSKAIIFYDQGSDVTCFDVELVKSLNPRKVDSGVLTMTTVTSRKELQTEFLEVSLLTRDGFTVTITGYSLPRLCGKPYKLNEQVINDTFPKFDAATLQRPDETVNVLLGADYFGYFPKLEIASSGHLSIMRGVLSTCIVGSHPDIIRPNPVNNYAGYTMTFSSYHNILSPMVDTPLFPVRVEVQSVEERAPDVIMTSGHALPVTSLSSEGGISSHSISPDDADLGGSQLALATPSTGGGEAQHLCQPRSLVDLSARIAYRSYVIGSKQAAADEKCVFGGELGISVSPPSDACKCGMCPMHGQTFSSAAAHTTLCRTEYIRSTDPPCKTASKSQVDDHVSCDAPTKLSEKKVKSLKGPSFYVGHTCPAASSRCDVKIIHDNVPTSIESTGLIINDHVSTLSSHDILNEMLEISFIYSEPVPCGNDKSKGSISILDGDLEICFLSVPSEKSSVDDAYQLPEKLSSHKTCTYENSSDTVGDIHLNYATMTSPQPQSHVNNDDTSKVSILSKLPSLLAFILFLTSMCFMFPAHGFCIKPDIDYVSYYSAHADNYILSLGFYTSSAYENTDYDSTFLVESFDFCSYDLFESSAHRNCIESCCTFRIFQDNHIALNVKNHSLLNHSHSINEKLKYGEYNKSVVPTIHPPGSGNYILFYIHTKAPIYTISSPSVIELETCSFDCKMFSSHIIDFSFDIQLERFYFSSGEYLLNGIFCFRYCIQQFTVLQHERAGKLKPRSLYSLLSLAKNSAHKMLNQVASDSFQINTCPGLRLTDLRSIPFYKSAESFPSQSSRTGIGLPLRSSHATIARNNSSPTCSLVCGANEMDIASDKSSFDLHNFAEVNINSSDGSIMANSLVFIPAALTPTHRMPVTVFFSLLI